MRVHHVPIPLLPRQVPRMAELDQTQLVVERLLHQDTEGARQPGQGQLLDAGPVGRGHVRQRELPSPEEEVQEAPAALRAAGQGDHGHVRHLRGGPGALSGRWWRSSRGARLSKRRVPVPAARPPPARLLALDLGGTEAGRVPGAAATVVQTRADHRAPDQADRSRADEDHRDTERTSAGREEEELQHRRSDWQTGGQRSELRRLAGSEPVRAQGDQEPGVRFLASGLEDPSVADFLPWGRREKRKRENLGFSKRTRKEDLSSFFLEMRREEETERIESKGRKMREVDVQVKIIQRSQRRRKESD